MIRDDDPTQSEFWISQLIFYCNVPPHFQSTRFPLWVDVIPIRTPPRSRFYLTHPMVGPHWYDLHQKGTNSLDASQAYGNRHVLPAIVDSGRWANLPVCPNPKTKPHTNPQKPYHMVLCTWTSASYHRRGEDEDQPMDDTVLRLREWLLFHQMAGFDHVVVYDNTQGIDDYETQSPIYQVLQQEFPTDFVTHQPWPAVICNNHRPGHSSPGDRSSQYAAEASCRERYGPLTEWMAFIDTDEYLTPVRRRSEDKTADDTTTMTWRPILEVSDAIHMQWLVLSTDDLIIFVLLLIFLSSI
jgi:Glycosyltransferase family 92